MSGRNRFLTYYLVIIVLFMAMTTIILEFGAFPSWSFLRSFQLRGGNPFSSKDEQMKHHRESFKEAVNLERRRVLSQCPSLKQDRVGLLGAKPGSLDIVITTVNFTSFFDFKVDSNESRAGCDYGAATMMGLPPSMSTYHPCDHESENIPKDDGQPQHRCDHRSSRSCCIKDASSKEWGTCVAPTDANQCRCPDCYDFRYRRRALLYNEVRQQLRSFEKHGLHVQSDEHPDGLIRKIFVVWNDGTGNPGPTFLSAGSDKVVLVPHHTLWKARGDFRGWPTSNRNAIAAMLNFIPDLGDWFLYLEDDIYLARPLDFRSRNELYINEDGMVVSWMNRVSFETFERPPDNGYQGAMWTSVKMLEKKFGKRGSSSARSLVQGMENVVIGFRGGEGQHGPRILNKCILNRLWELWPDLLNSTVGTNCQEKSDVHMTTLSAGFMEDLGFGINNPDEYKSPIFEYHTVKSSTVDDLVSEICWKWKHPSKDWLQVQGYGISDEYGSPMGDVRFAWAALSQMMWPTASVYETNAFGDTVLEALKLREAGEALCAAHEWWWEKFWP